MHRSKVFAAIALTLAVGIGIGAAGTAGSAGPAEVRTVTVQAPAPSPITITVQASAPPPIIITNTVKVPGWNVTPDVCLKAMDGLLDLVQVTAEVGLTYADGGGPSRAQVNELEAAMAPEVFNYVDACYASAKVGS